MSGLQPPDRAAPLAPHHTATRKFTMFNVLSNRILIRSNAYDEYTFVPWLNRHVYRRTVDLSVVCIQ
jgi:hypothetical protein